MIDIFKKHAPAYQRLVRKFALDVWKDRADKKDFLFKAERYKKKYEADLIKHYHDEGIKIHPGTIRATANQWLVDQKALVESVETIAQAKKQNLTAELFEKLKSDKSAEVQKLLNKIYLSKKDTERGAEVYKVFSFTENLEARAVQLGEQSAFDLGAEVNHAVLTELGDKYKWNTQEDKKVRKTHRMLNRKTFLYSNPPTTKDKYGNVHTGHPGTDYGCVIGSTRIIIDSNIKSLFRRYYSGKLTMLITTSGPLYLTPNHPMLTNRGWVAAKDLKWFDKIVKIPSQMTKAIKSDITNSEATADEIFDFFKLLRNPLRVGGRTVQFHGDGVAEHEVDIIRTDRKLMCKFDTIRLKKFSKFRLASPYEMCSFVSKSTLSNFMSKLWRMFLASIGIITGLCKCLTFSFSHALKSQIISFRSGSRDNSSRKNNISNHKTTYTKLSRTGKFTKTTFIETDDFTPFITSDFARTLFVAHFNYSGYVYNFETTTGIYYANRMTSHNCRCYEEPSNAKPYLDYIAQE